MDNESLDNLADALKIHPDHLEGNDIDIVVKAIIILSEEIVAIDDRLRGQ